MRTVLSYILLVCLSLSGFSTTVQAAHGASQINSLVNSISLAYSYTLADALHAAQNAKTQKQADTTNTNAAAAMPCHRSGAEPATPQATPQQPSETGQHDCCDTTKHVCQSDCCAKHCAAGSALLSNELLRYQPTGDNAAVSLLQLPRWLFAAESPPPINA